MTGRQRRDLFISYIAAWSATNSSCRGSTPSIASTSTAGSMICSGTAIRPIRSSPWPWPITRFAPAANPATTASPSDGGRPGGRHRVAVPGSRPLARHAARAAPSLAWHHAHRSGAAAPTSTRRQGRPARRSRERGPRAPAASRPSHERPGGRGPRPFRLATWQEGRVVRIVDDTGPDRHRRRPVRLVRRTRRGRSWPIGRSRPAGRGSWSGPPTRRTVPARTASRGRVSRSASRSSAGRAGGCRSRRRGRARRSRSCRAARWGGSTGRTRAPYMCTWPSLVPPHTSPSRRRRTFPFPVRPTRANVDGRRLPAAATKEGPSP